MCDDFYQALKHPEFYHFGGEGPIADFWYYKTQELYLRSSAIMNLWFALGFLFCLLQNKFKNLKWGIVMHLFLTLLYVFIINSTDILNKC
jgi:hypothetical protein